MYEVNPWVEFTLTGGLDNLHIDVFNYQSKTAKHDQH